MTQYLLEKSRVASVAEGERNYHVLYHLAEGAPKEKRAALGLEKGPASFYYLNQSSVKTLASMEDVGMYNELVGAFTACGVNDAQHFVDQALLYLVNVFGLSCYGYSSALVSLKPTRFQKAIVMPQRRKRIEVAYDCLWLKCIQC